MVNNNYSFTDDEWTVLRVKGEEIARIKTSKIKIVYDSIRKYFTDGLDRQVQSIIKELLDE